MVYGNSSIGKRYIKSLQIPLIRKYLQYNKQQYTCNINNSQ